MRHPEQSRESSEVFINMLAELMNLFTARFRLGVVFFLLASVSFAAQSSFDLMERANALYRDGKFKQAIMLYHKAQDRGADPVAVSFNIANSYYQMDK